VEEIFRACLIICPLVFLGGFVDSVAGGGGLITLPAYMLAGIPVHIAMGTNKVAASMGGVTATIQYFRGGKINFAIAIPAAFAAFAGSAVGAEIALHLSEQFLNILLLIILPVVAIFLALKKDFGRETPEARKLSTARILICSILLGFFIGMYDGLVGPGTGTFMIMGLSAFLSLDLITSSGCSKLANTASGFAAALVFLLDGKIMWAVLIPAVISNMLGGYFGSRYAIRGGSSRIRSMIFVVLGLLFVKMISEIIR